MLYSQLYLKDKARIPVPLGIFFVLLTAVVLGRFFFNQGTSYTRASKKTVKRVEVTNVSPVQVSVFWQSEKREDGFILYGETEASISKVALDDRDVAERKNEYLNHYVTIRNLKPNSLYFFKIVTGSQLVVKPDGAAFFFKTPVTNVGSPQLSPANGKVVAANLNPLEGAIVLLQVDGFYPLSTITKSSGEWLVPLNSFYDKTTGESKIQSATQKARIEIIAEDGKVSTVMGTLSSFAPLSSTTVIGENYNVGEGDNVLSASSKSKFASAGPIDVIYPVEGALIPGRIPLIKGLALPLSEVSITVRSKKTFSAKIKANNKGQWSYLVPESLSLGGNTIDIVTKDSQGKEFTMTRKFVIVDNAGEGKVLGEASGSPTLTLAPTATTAPTSEPSVTNPPTTITPTGLLNSGITSVIPGIAAVSFIVLGLGFLLVF